MDKKKQNSSPETAENVQPAAATAPEAAEKTVEEQLREELEKANAAAEDFKRKWYTVTAEYENYRKRNAAIAAYRYVEGRADVVKGLFPIADNLDRALAASRDDATRRGVQLVITAFEKLLDEENISVISPVGEPFDATKCEAIMAVAPAQGEESGVVKQVYLKGYEQNGKVLRYAQVIVTK